nr:hypothetical protein [Sicyoidochytrium minutum DNA virus]
MADTFSFVYRCKYPGKLKDLVVEHVDAVTASNVHHLVVIQAINKVFEDNWGRVPADPIDGEKYVCLRVRHFLQASTEIYNKFGGFADPQFKDMFEQVPKDDDKYPVFVNNDDLSDIIEGTIEGPPHIPIPIPDPKKKPWRLSLGRRFSLKRGRE